MNSKRSEALSLVAVFVMLVVSSLGAALNLLGFRLRLSSGLPWDWSDGLIASMKLNLLYHSPASIPYLLTYYPPLSYLIEQSSGSPLLTGKVLALIGMALSAASVGLLTKKLMKDAPAWVPPFSVILTLSTGFLSAFGLFLIPMWFATGLALTGCCLGLSKRWWLCVPLFLAAFFVRQDAILPIGAFVLYLGLNGEKTKAVEAGLAFAIPSFYATLMLEIATKGQYVEQVFLLPLKTGDVALSVYASRIFYAWPLAPVFIMGAWFALRHWRSLPALLLASSAFSTVSLAKIGASGYYLDFFWACACLCAACSLASFHSLSGWRKPAALFVFAFCCIPTIAGAGRVSYAGEASVVLSLPPGRLLTDSPNVAYLAGEPVYIDTSVLWAIKPNISSFIGQVDSGYFSVVAIYQNDSVFCYYPGLVAAIDAHFHQVAESEGWDIGTYDGTGPLIDASCEGGP